MQTSIEEFISRRFPTDCNWLNGNCYFFALILNDVFDGKIYYDPVNGHFLFRWDYDGKFYDWSGQVEYSQQEISKFEDWYSYISVDYLHYQRIVRDCIL